MKRTEKRRQRILGNKTARNSDTEQSASHSPGELVPEELIERAVQLHSAGHLPEAEAIYYQILQASPNQPIALHLLGVIAFQVGKNDVAVELIRKALAIKPEYPEALNNLGNALKKLKNVQQAVECYRKAIDLKPGYVEALNNLGNAYVELGKLEEAEESFLQVIAIQPEYVEALNNLGNAIKHQGRLDEALELFHRALDINPQHIEVMNSLGNTYKDMSEPGEAIEIFRKALAIKPDHAVILNNLGLALQHMGRLDEAIEALRKASQISPATPGVQYNLHALLLDPDDVTTSIECMEKAIETSPLRAGYKFTIGMLLDYSGNPPKAAPYFDAVEKGAALERANLDAWRYLKSAQEKTPSIFGSPIQAFELGLKVADVDGLVLEFGVRTGTSIRQIAALVDQEVHGFDSFQGIPEAWHHEPEGTYSTKGRIPSVPDNVSLHVGWFEETLPSFVEEFQEPIRFVNIDCDLYSSTKTILDLLSNQVVTGTVIVFDEYIGHETWREDEFKAFQESVTKYGWKYEYLSFSFSTKQVVVRIN